ncbi:MAG TPA: DUF4335 domain-containing protein [Crinalium sp.]
MASSVLRQYTPPTCTLEIAAKESPLSRWTDRSVLKHLRFQLSFDDPRLAAEQQVRVTGDRTQLEILCDAVEAYVQTLLDSAPLQLGQAYDQPPSAPTSSSNGTNGTASLRLVPESQNGDGNHYQTAPSSVEAVTQPQNGVLLSHPHGIFLEPRGLLSHLLHLGTLAADDAHETVSLSTLQLFDLANALDGYKADALALPTLNRPAWTQSRSGMLRVAAIALLAVGVTSVVGKFMMDVGSPSMQTASNPEAQSGDQSVSMAPTGPTPSAIPTTTPFPQVTPLPPPPPLGVTKQPAAPFPSVGVPRAVTPGTSQAPATRVPTTPTIPALPPLSAIPRQITPVAPAPAARSNQGQTQLQIPEQPSITAARPTAREGAGAAQSNDTFESEPSLRAADQAQPAPPASLPSGVSADSVPQVAEVRQYFQNWRPPAGLNRPVEYRLLIGPDGTIKQIIPLGEAAGTYVDRTGMPLVGDPFVSPIDSGKSALIRLVLNPDGSVQTFLEALE